MTRREDGFFEDELTALMNDITGLKSISIRVRHGIVDFFIEDAELPHLQRLADEIDLTEEELLLEVLHDAAYDMSDAYCEWFNRQLEGRD